ncbi:MAG: DJ-1/PfpI family protein [Gammaproteobacteria bacterium]|nr:DJ-1/PfpI family protein [Gammaproteobacteria bacterium]
MSRNKYQFPMKVGVVLFEGFELLDIFGPLEMFGMLPGQFNIHLVVEGSNPVASAQGPRSVIDDSFASAKQYDILLVPGGPGARTEVNNPTILDWLRHASQISTFVTSVCTGSALLAKSDVLDGRRATTNKYAFNWVTTQGEKVRWIYEARWIEDGKFFTSSGVSAGMDMTLGLIERILGRESSEQLVNCAEYEWHSDSSRDPFAVLNRPNAGTKI